MKPQDCEIVIRPLTEAESGGFGATVPELPGCMSDGETPQEALDNVYDAIACRIEAREEMGRPCPSRSAQRPEANHWVNSDSIYLSAARQPPSAINVYCHHLLGRRQRGSPPGASYVPGTVPPWHRPSREVASTQDRR